ncbi:uncharacterized protein OCT59_001335 [Rhizophagus irregularis]|uniref:uncharacterized protein n=1 Tax=Rhizophagus irregularis TaxID=588596 RepID=UPI00332F40A0|nr:hypothetical protein OCT59_001335 [Rhizophagus irregularis]
MDINIRRSIWILNTRCSIWIYTSSSRANTKVYNGAPSFASLDFWTSSFLILLEASHFIIRHIQNVSLMHLIRYLRDESWTRFVT